MPMAFLQDDSDWRKFHSCSRVGRYALAPWREGHSVQLLFAEVTGPLKEFFTLRYQRLEVEPAPVAPAIEDSRPSRELYTVTEGIEEGETAPPPGKVHAWQRVIVGAQEYVLLDEAEVEAIFAGLRLSASVSGGARLCGLWVSGGV